MKRFKNWSEKPLTNGGMLKLYLIGIVAGIIAAIIQLAAVFDWTSGVVDKFRAIKNKIFRKNTSEVEW